jgi:hypothetical protein
LEATGLAATGLAATRLATTGLAATGLAATGVAATGLAAATSLSVPGFDPFCLSLSSTAGATATTIGLAFLAGSEALLSLLFRLTAPSRKYISYYMFLDKTEKSERSKVHGLTNLKVVFAVLIWAHLPTRS